MGEETIVAQRIGFRRLTRLQRMILLTMLEHEEREEEVSGAEKSVTPEVVTEYILEKREKEANPYAPDRLEKIFGIQLELGATDVRTFFYNYKNLVDEVRRCLQTMARIGLAQRNIYFPHERYPLIAYRLTPFGRLKAKTLRFEKQGRTKVEEKAGELVEQAVGAIREERLKAGQPPYATPEEILEKLWQLSPELYENERKIFDKYWNKRKLGVEMRKGGYRLVYKVLNEKLMWVYDLLAYTPEEQMKDLKTALVDLRRQGFWRATTDIIIEALWKTCGAKFVSKEAFEKVWNERLIGKLMHKLGLPRRHKRSPTETELADGTLIQYYMFQWVYDIRTIPKEEF